MSSPKKCLLLLNVGTPDSPDRKAVRQYLTAFLNDKRVIDLPWLWRKILVNGIIIPFRLKTSMGIYQQLWNKHGRVLITITERLVQRLQRQIGVAFEVRYAMRYGNPSVENVVQTMAAEKFEEVYLLPLFPHTAMSTTETVLVEANRCLKNWLPNTKVKTLPTFFDMPEYIASMVQNSKAFSVEKYDHILFSYHGLPNRHIRKAHKQIGYKENEVCDGVYESAHRGCYKAECYETTRLLATALQLPKTQYSTAFQSRLTKNWLQPFSDEKIVELANSGVKKLLVFTPSFTIDCLETLNEIGEEYAELFYENGGTQLDLVPCLNDSDAMVDLVEELLKQQKS